MSKRILITCKMIEDETMTVLKKLNADLDIVWMDKKLHDRPEELKDAIQDEINKYQNYDEILLGFGLCGNGLLGISSEKTRLVMPRFDDCVNQLLYTGARLSRGLTDGVSMYLTKSWTLDDDAILQKTMTIWEEYADEDDDEMAQDILNMMYGQYHNVTVIDTGCYDISETVAYAKEAAKILNLNCNTVKGSLKIIEMLITGNYDRNFIVLQPGEAVDFNMFNDIF